MSDSKLSDEAAGANAKAEVEATENKSPTKRTPKRKADAFQKESEELLKTLGVTVDMEDGRRRTRSSARGGPATPTTAPATPPAKRARGGVPTNSAKRSKQDEDVEEEETPNSKGTPKKRGHAGPKKLLDLVEKEPSDEKDLAVPLADGTDASEVAKDTSPGKEEASNVTPPAADDKDVKESQADKSADDEAAKQDEADSATVVADAKEPAETATDKAAEVLPMDQQKSGEDAVEKPVTPSKEKKVIPLEKGEPTATESSMEVGEQNKSLAADEGKKSEEAADEAETADSNGDGEATATVSQEATTPEKKEVPTVKEFHAEKEPSDVDEVKKSNATAESSTIQESDKTTTPSVTVNNVDSATENNVAEKVSSSVETKIVTNVSAAVEPTTAP